MRRFDHTAVDADVVCGELLNGHGAVAITGLFSGDQIAEARRIVMAHSEATVDTVTHFQGDAENRGVLDRQRRVWNLLAKGTVFADMASHPTIVTLLRRFLGSAFIMGSIAANRILPGGPGQEPHIDYPYWDFHQPETHPVGINASFPLNAQVTILLDPFTVDNGATAYVPGSQRMLRYPTEEDRFTELCTRMVGKPGDTILFFGAVWHCAMPNRSDADRSAVLIQYLPKWVKPMEDIPAALAPSFIDEASEDMRQLLGLKYPYPEVLERAGPGNTEGRR